MISLKTTGFSSRVRYLLIVILTLLPFSGVLVFVGGLAYLPTYRTMDDMIVVVMDEMVPLSSLQRSLLNAAMPPNDYIIHKNPSEKDLFRHSGKEIERAFSLLRVAYREHSDKLARIDSAHAAWLHTFENGHVLMSFVDDGNYDSAREAMEDFDSDIQVVIDILNEVHESTLHNLIEQNANVTAMKDKGIIIMVLAFLMALILGVLGSVWLTRRNKSLEDQSMHDQLTGAFNRRACDEKFNNLIRTTVSLERQTFSLIMMDVDHFKSVNDTYGHSVGDEALKTVAGVIEKHLRGTDFFARFGGEEFLIMIPDGGKFAVKELANRLRIAIMETPINVVDGGTFNVTMSFGIAEFPTDATSQGGLIHLADIALYQAKQSGRNKVVVYVDDESD
ncbi:GGDEF domain-containing protein [Pseudomonadota bacterium]